MEWLVPPFIAERFSAEPGAYVLELELSRAVRLRLCASSPVNLGPGVVRYYGSARGSGGLRARLARHLRSLRKEAPRHWHIDQLLQHRGARLLRVGVAVDGDECRLCAADRARGWELSPAPFGATDCRAGCGSHLLVDTRASCAARVKPRGASGAPPQRNDTRSGAPTSRARSRAVLASSSARSAIHRPLEPTPS